VPFSLIENGVYNFVLLYTFRKTASVQLDQERDSGNQNGKGNQEMTVGQDSFGGLEKIHPIPRGSICSG
jgi:hypothetical protein